jgi:hypothetical protein
MNESEFLKIKLKKTTRVNVDRWVFKESSGPIKIV